MGQALTHKQDGGDGHQEVNGIKCGSSLDRVRRFVEVDAEVGDGDDEEQQAVDDLQRAQPLERPHATRHQVPRHQSRSLTSAALQHINGKVKTYARLKRCAYKYHKVMNYLLRCDLNHIRVYIAVVTTIKRS